MTVCVMHCPGLRCIVLHCPSLPCMSCIACILSCTVLHYPSLSCTVMQYPALSCTVKHCPALSSIHLHSHALSCNALQYTALSCHSCKALMQIYDSPTISRPQTTQQPSAFLATLPEENNDMQILKSLWDHLDYSPNNSLAELYTSARTKPDKLYSQMEK